MNIRILLLLFCLTVSLCVSAGKNKIYPTPQFLSQTGKTITLNTPVFLNGKTEADPSAVEQLRQIFEVKEQKKNYTLYIGERGDKAVKKYTQHIPEVSGGYYLSIQPDRMVIAGHDEKGTFYAVQTLKQLWNNQTLPVVEIKDYPAVAYRGIVEGFYGQPWSHEDRIRQLRFYGENKLNIYIYGPKDDPYHSSPNWRKPYPEKEARQISELVTLSKANKVNFVWAIHPGQDIQWNANDRQALLEKFEKMYELGVRSFAVFFDDIAGEGTDPNRQAELLNYLHDHFVAVKKDVTPLIMCPTEYNKSWSDPKPGSYLDILGEKLYPSVMIMWTGDRVISDITSEGLEWINKRIKRPAYIWWNFPVNDYVRDHLLMGPSYGLDRGAGNQMSGFVSNPMERAEASKIAIFAIADYAWNPAAYDSNAAWEKAIQTLMPQTASALRIFAAHNSDPGKNGHRYRRDESVEIKAEAEKLLAAYRKGQLPAEALEKIKTEYQKIREAALQLKTSAENPALTAEIRPWIEQFEILGQAGLKALEIAELTTPSLPSGRIQDYWAAYRQLQSLETQRRKNDRTYNQNPYQPGVKTGSLVMQPLIDSIRFISEQRFFAGKSTKTDSVSVAPLLYTDIEQIRSLPLLTTENSISISPALEVIRIAPQQYVGIRLPYSIIQANFIFNLNVPSVLKWAKIEISNDGKTWTPLKATEKERSITVVLPENMSFSYIRIINNSKQNREIYLKKFSIEADFSGGLTNNPALLQDANLQTACQIQAGQTVISPNPAAGQQVNFILLGDENKTGIIISGKNAKGETTELGRIGSGYGEFHCPADVEFLHFSTTSDHPVFLYELIRK